MQLRILRLDLLQDRNIPVGVFPEPEEVLLRQPVPGYGGIGVPLPLRSSRLQSVGPSHAQMR